MEQVFCVEVVKPASNWRAEHGLWRNSELQLTAEASFAAQQIVLQARQQADSILAVASAEAELSVQSAEQAVWQRAQHLLVSLEQEHWRFLQRAESMILDLTQALFERLISESSQRDQLAASLRRLQLEAPPRLLQAVLHVNPSDVNFLPELEWELKTDSALEPGSCRLEAECGVWCASFDSAVQNLKVSLAKRCEQAEAATQLKTSDMD